ncbi:hypothetical protein, partial [Alistipes communis]|uniref:hypothetical protein n=1 Tax=Alistipes communis TaxID=2585118 RepID=UPI003AF5747B
IQRERHISFSGVNMLNMSGMRFYGGCGRPYRFERRRLEMRGFPFAFSEIGAHVRRGIAVGEWMAGIWRLPEFPYLCGNYKPAFL